MTPDDLAPGIPVEVVVGSEEAGLRLDVFLAQRFPAHSRVQMRRAINALGVRVDDAKAKAAYRVVSGQRIRITLPDLPRSTPEPEDVPLSILYEDDWLAAVNKPPGMVVHPSKGHWKGTLTAALAFHFRQLSSAGGPARPGVVHRLDRDTSGVILIAKHDRAHLALANQFAARTVEKEYRAIVVGVPDWDRERIDRPIGVHPTQREKMAIRAGHSTSREAVTMVEVIERFRGFTYVRAFPKTGRTHQIRVHLNHVRAPVLCDRLYSGRATIGTGQLAGGLASGDDPVLLDRQALHAFRIRLAHPSTGEPFECTAPLPDDFQRVLDQLSQPSSRRPAE